METDGGWISISEASRLYQKDRKWVSNQINAYDLETRKRGNQKQLRLTDLISAPGASLMVTGLLPIRVLLKSPRLSQMQSHMKSHDLKQRSVISKSGSRSSRQI